MDPKLTLATAVTRGRISETVKKQQSELKVLVEPAAGDADKNRRKPKQGKPITSRKPEARLKSCRCCGREFQIHSECPTKNVTCRFCHDWDSVTLEPEQPMVHDGVISVEPEDEKNTIPDENQKLEQSKHVSSLDISSSNSDHLQWLEQLEWENEQLKQHLT